MGNDWDTSDPAELAALFDGAVDYGAFYTTDGAGNATYHVADAGELGFLLDPSSDVFIPGSVVRLEAGVYETGRLVLAQPVTLQGSTEGDTILDGLSADAGEPGLIFVMPAPGPVSIENIVFRNYLRDGSGWTCIAAADLTAPLAVRECRFEGHGGTERDVAIRIADAGAGAPLLFEDDEFTAMWSAVRVENPLGGVVVRNCSFHDMVSESDGTPTFPEPIYIAAAGGDAEAPVVVSDNRITGLYGTAIAVVAGAGSEPATLTGTVISGNIVDGGNATDEGRSAIYLANAVTDADRLFEGGFVDTYIAGNTITNGGGGSIGIRLAGFGTGFDVLNNTVSGQACAVSVVSYEGTADAAPQEVSVRNNDLSGNTLGICNDTESSVYGGFNSWGTGDPEDLVGMIRGDVEIDVWYELSPGSVPNILHVTPEGSIQDAVEAASDGDTIMLMPGTYYEHITIYKSVMLRGSGRTECVIDGLQTEPTVEDVIVVSADGVEIYGLTVRNGLAGAGPEGADGIRISSADDVLVHDCLISGNSAGIHQSTGSDGLRVWNSVIKDNEQGLLILGTGVVLFGNIIYSNPSSDAAGGAGITVMAGGAVTARYNAIYFNGNLGVNAEAGATADAVFNYWGANSGPYNASLNPTGTGDTVSEGVVFDPWIGKEETATGGAPVTSVVGLLPEAGETLSAWNASDGYSITCETGSGAASVMMVHYTASPVERRFEQAYGDAFFDVFVPDASNITRVVAEFYYPVGITFGAGELPLHYFDGERWRAVEGQEVHPGPVELEGVPYGGYIRAVFSAASTPALGELNGTAFSIGIRVSASGGGGGCFVATAAFGSLASGEVTALTAVRDRSIRASATGAALVDLYYAAGPAAAAYERRSDCIRSLVRRLLR